MATLSLDTTATPFPWTLFLLATHLSLPIDYSSTNTKTTYGSHSGVEAVEEALKEQLAGKGKENALPTTPTAFNAGTTFPEIGPIFNRLDDHLALRTYFAGRKAGYNDLLIWGHIKSSPKAIGVLKQSKHTHLLRWYTHIEQLPASQEAIQGLIKARSLEAKQAKTEKDKSGTVEVELPNAKKGEVVVRFAPEPSGYLHIGHIKACILNRYLATKYDGKFILRFDDTNPEKEEDEFEGSFQSDLKMLGVEWNKVVHTSDWFGEIEKMARGLVEKGLAFMDDTDQITMREQRSAFIPSKNRDNSTSDNLARFDEMIKGSEEGQKWFMRAKIDYKSPNGAMRDPAVYRCVDKAHHVTGTKYKAYPMYDLACPIVDSLDGVTHALRANEYADRKVQYDWFLNALGLKHIEIFEFSRLDFVYTLLSKRKLKHLVERGMVSSWEDPRFPTIRGMRARGLTLEALKGFIASQGASATTLLMEWDQIWAWNKKVIDPIAPRYWAIAEEDMVKVTVKGGPETSEVRSLPVHKKNPAIGEKKVTFGSDLIMEQVDVEAFGDNEEITAMDWGNAFVRSKTSGSSGKISEVELELHLEGDFKKTSKKVHWMAKEAATVPVVLIDYDYLITKKKIEEADDFTACLNNKTEYRVKAVSDANIKDLKKFDIIQFERKGFYIYQGTQDSEGRMEFGFIPDGRVSTVALKATEFKADTTAEVGKPGEKGWGKDAKPTLSSKPQAQSSDAKPASNKAGQNYTQSTKPDGSIVKTYLSDVNKGFEMPSTTTMYEVDRVYGNEEVNTPADSVDMFTVKPVYDN